MSAKLTECAERTLFERTNLMSIKTAETAAIEKLHAEWDNLPETTREFYIHYGIKQNVQDSHVAGKTLDEKEGLIAKKLAKALAGTLDIRESNRESDPVAREVTKLAVAKTDAHFRAKGIKAKDVSKADYKNVLDQFRNHPKIVALAESNVAALNAADISL